VKKSIVLLTLVAAVVAAMLAPTASAAKVIRTAMLTGGPNFPAVHGDAKWSAEAGQRELEVSIEDANRIRGVELRVVVGGKQVGTMVVDDLGAANLDLHTAAGDAVPFVNTGTRVVVRRVSNNALVASGTF
jgi:hypothetical protein